MKDPATHVHSPHPKQMRPSGLTRLPCTAIMACQHASHVPPTHLKMSARSTECSMLLKTRWKAG
jgi:hypothetical protein